MEDEKKTTSLHDCSGMDERIRNTAELLINFAKENLDKETAEEIARDLSGITDDE